VDLHAVEPGVVHGVAGGDGVQLRVLVDLRDRERARDRLGALDRDVRGGDDLEAPVLARPSAQSWRKMNEPLACTASVTYNRHPSASPGDTERTFRFRRGAHPLPRRDLGVVVDAGHVVVPARLGGDERRLGDEQRAGHARALGVIRLRELAVDVLLVRAVAREQVEDDAVLERHGADFDRLEELGRGGHSSGRVIMVVLVGDSSQGPGAR
jgi:hypothetical protein